jgi:hypothetical protein
LYRLLLPLFPLRSDCRTCYLPLLCSLTLINVCGRTSQKQRHVTANGLIYTQNLPSQPSCADKSCKYHQIKICYSPTWIQGCTCTNSGREAFLFSWDRINPNDWSIWYVTLREWRPVSKSWPQSSIWSVTSFGSTIPRSS